MSETTKRAASRDDLETLIARVRSGDDDARERLFSIVYPEMRRLARYYLKQERPGHTLQPTALVHEVFIKIAGGESVDWRNRAHLMAVIARQMRWILVDHGRRHRALKRGDTWISLELSREPARRVESREDILAVNQALTDLQSLDERVAQVVELRVFGQLTESDIAYVLRTSASTVKRDWRFAKSWLANRLR
jgi:RNA polymerase sigma factor (TIGR02999 family)